MAGDRSRFRVQSGAVFAQSQVGPRPLTFCLYGHIAVVKATTRRPLKSIVDAQAYQWVGVPLVVRAFRP
ncbi:MULTISPECIES: hypothetical protein [Mesorhizobium]|uniref:hypothetical protein n=1 Tax=Mesorhizobium TaxID=68287 RepID=UPI0010BFE4BE|nr:MULTISPECIES: hypothetical protein [Mesorhizobium]